MVDNLIELPQNESAEGNGIKFIVTPHGIKAVDTTVSALESDNTEESRSSDPEKIVKEMLSDIKANFIGGDKITGLATGLTDLDKILHGLHAPDLDIIAARPAMGKTAFALNIAVNVAAKQHIPVEFFSLEMSAKQLYQRLWATEGNINFGSMQNVVGCPNVVNS